MINQAEKMKDVDRKKRVKNNIFLLIKPLISIVNFKFAKQ
jgi:hypothetical protein